MAPVRVTCVKFVAGCVGCAVAVALGNEVDVTMSDPVGVVKVGVRTVLVVMFGSIDVGTTPELDVQILVDLEASGLETHPVPGEVVAAGTEDVEFHPVKLVTVVEERMLVIVRLSLVGSVDTTCEVVDAVLQFEDAKVEMDDREIEPDALAPEEVAVEFQPPPLDDVESDPVLVDR